MSGTSVALVLAVVPPVLDGFPFRDPADAKFSCNIHVSLKPCVLGTFCPALGDHALCRYSTRMLQARSGSGGDGTTDVSVIN